MERDIGTKKIIKEDGVLLQSRGVDHDIGFVFKMCPESSNNPGFTRDCSKGGGAKPKVKKKQPQTSLGEIVIKKKETYYRSTLKTALKELNLLRFNDDHIRQIKKTPFWMLFNAIYGADCEILKGRCEKNEDLLRKIILCFNRSIDKFVIGGNKLKLSKLDVNLIMGVSGGEGNYCGLAGIYGVVFQI